MGEEENKRNEIPEPSKINNNLFAIRTLLELIIEKQYNKKMDWNKETKRFEISDLP